MENHLLALTGFLPIEREDKFSLAIVVNPLNSVTGDQILLTIFQNVTKFFFSNLYTYLAYPRFLQS